MQTMKFLSIVKNLTEIWAKKCRGLCISEFLELQPFWFPKRFEPFLRQAIKTHMRENLGKSKLEKDMKKLTPPLGNAGLGKKRKKMTPPPNIKKFPSFNFRWEGALRHSYIHLSKPELHKIFYFLWTGV